MPCQYEQSPHYQKFEVCNKLQLSSGDKLGPRIRDLLNENSEDLRRMEKL
jgi:hypothetical protein